MRLTQLLESATATLYHGGAAWSRAEIRPTGPGRHEHGPGIYLTTKYDTARSYAGGSKIVQRVTVDLSRVRLPHKCEITIEDALELLGNIRLKNRRAVVDDLKSYSARRTAPLTAGVVNNLLVNHDAITGNAGPIVAKWLVDHGATAEINSKAGEDWLIVFDPSIILKAEKVDPKTVNSDFAFDLPQVFDRV